MSRPLLTVIIPTYNRGTQLEPLLGEFVTVVETVGSKLQLIVCDNASTDRTPEILKTHRSVLPAMRIVRRNSNYGMEGNIACAMLEGDGDYVWVLSDHQQMCAKGLLRALDVIAKVDFDIGHAKIAQWSSALPVQEKVIAWSEISRQERGALLFSLGNLSTLIFRRSLVAPSAKSIFKACYWSYPHLGILSQINPETRLIEFRDLSSFPTSNRALNIKTDYDKISVRYCNNLKCVEELSKKADMAFDRSGFFTRDYCQSFRFDVLLLLQKKDLTRVAALKSLLPLLPLNPWRLKAVALFVLASCVILPRTIRTGLAARARSYRQKRDAFI